MSTNNIQERGLEGSIFFITADTSEENIKDVRNFNDCFEKDCPDERIVDYIYESFNDEMEHSFGDVLDEEGRCYDIDVYDNNNEEWVNLEFTIRMASCYYSGVNLIIVCENYDLEDLDLGKTSHSKIDTVIRKLEKVCRNHSTEIRCIGRASNGEAFYEKV